MKRLMMMALAAGSIAVAAPAMAQHVEQHRTTIHREVSVQRHDNGWHGAKRHHKRRVCRTSWRNHHRVRNCFWR